MRVLEEPFVTRGAILNVYRPGHIGTESPLRTLKNAGCATNGLRVDLRGKAGHLGGSAQLFSVLNADAARAARLQQQTLARALTDRAREIEGSPDAHAIRDAVQELVGSARLDPDDERSPVNLRRYTWLRGKTTWSGIDRGALMREWLVHSAAWLEHDELGSLADAVVALARSAEEARADLIRDELPPVFTFYGIVRRMDPAAAEVEGEDGTRLVPRGDLERQGLAVAGQAVALLCEALPGGGTLTYPMPAVRLDTPPAVRDDLFSGHDDLGSGILGTVLDSDDQAWLERALARQPTAIPVAPIRRA